MRLKFKHQQFQKDAAQAVTDVFFGQPYSDRNTYQIDQGAGGGNFFASDPLYYPGYLFQTISGLTVGKDYTLTFDSATIAPAQ